MHKTQRRKTVTRDDVSSAHSSDGGIRRIGTLLSTSFNRGMSLEAIAAMLGHRSLE
jgi:hypothetical protein